MVAPLRLDHHLDPRRIGALLSDRGRRWLSTVAKMSCTGSLPLHGIPQYSTITYENVDFQRENQEGRIDEHSALAHFDPQPFPVGRNPALRYLARLSPGSRRTQKVALDRIATLMTGGTATAMEMPWHLLDAQQTGAIRAAMQTHYAPPTINRMLAALRGVPSVYR